MFVLTILFIASLNIPLPSHLHFIEPLDECVWSEICNHTWIVECGYDEASDNKRPFSDDCDMHEYNCDKNKLYKPINYSECFTKNPCNTFSTTNRKRILLRSGLHMTKAPKRKWHKRVKSRNFPHKKKFSRPPTSRKSLNTLTRHPIFRKSMKYVVKKDFVIRNGTKFLRIMKKISTARREIMKKISTARRALTCPIN